MSDLGNFVTGERPHPLTVGFTDFNGKIIDITGMTARFVYEVDGAAPVIRTTATVSNGPAGEATYAWVDADFATPGLYFAEMWVGTTGGVKLASERYSYHVRQAIAVPTF